MYVTQAITSFGVIRRAVSSAKKRKKKENLINRKVVTKWELSKTEVFWRIYHYSGRKTIKTENKQTPFLEDERIIHNFRSIGKFRHKTLVLGVFLENLYTQGMRSYIIKTFCWFPVEGDQIYLMYGRFGHLSTKITIISKRYYSLNTWSLSNLKTELCRGR